MFGFFFSALLHFFGCPAPCLSPPFIWCSRLGCRLNHRGHCFALDPRGVPLPVVPVPPRDREVRAPALPPRGEPLRRSLRSQDGLSPMTSSAHPLGPWLRNLLPRLIRSGPTQSLEPLSPPLASFRWRQLTGFPPPTEARFPVGIPWFPF
jgi:hypothetical protein